METKVPANSEAVAHAMTGLGNAHRWLAIALFLTGGTAIWIARTVFHSAAQSHSNTASQDSLQIGVVIGLSVYALLAAVHGVLSLIVAQNIRARRSYGLTVTLGVANILVFPLGTVVAVYAMLTLFKPGIKNYFTN